MRALTSSILLLLAIVLLQPAIQSCNIAKHIPKDSLLLNEVNIKGAPAGTEEELRALLQQEPNTKLFGLIRFRMWRAIIFNQKEKNQKKIRKTEEKINRLEARVDELEAQNASEKKLKRADERVDKQQEKIETLKRKEFEEPVLYDSIKTQSTSDQMEDFLFNWGWYNNTVTFELDTIKDVKANVVYNIEPRNAFYVNRFDRKIEDSALVKIIDDDSLPAPLRRGDQYNGDSLANYRDQLTLHFREKGYFNFSRDYITYQVDSNKTGDSVNVGMTIQSPPGRTTHRVFKVNDVFVEPEYYIVDTMPKDSFIYEDYIFISRALTVKPKIIADYVFFRKGQFYKASDYRQTLNRLAQLQLYKFVDITFTQDTLNRPDTGLLNVYIRLTPMDRRVVGADLAANRVEQTAGSFVNSTTVFAGVSSSLSYVDRNLFKRVIQLEIRPRGGIDIPVTSFGRGGSLFDSAVYEYGLTTSLSIPRLWAPGIFLKKPFFRYENNLKFDSRTSFNVSYLRDYTLFFERRTFNFNLTYQWRDPLIRFAKAGKLFKGPVQVRNANVFFTPLEVNLIDAEFRNNRFRDTILKSGDPLLINLYDPHIITNTKLTLLLNQQPLSMVKSPLWLFRTTGEIGGLMFGLVNKYIRGNDEQGTLFGDLYYSYLRWEGDIRRYQPIGTNNKSNLVVRLITGIGVPMLNSQNLAFEKRFYVGGSNSMRAWRLRELGPGQYNDSTDNIRFDRTGDIRLETNLEYRFPIYGIFNGAIFTDIGNVWTLKKEEARGDLGVFPPIWKVPDQLAIAGGFGLRLDLSFFIIRLDLAVPIRDPSQFPDGNPLENLERQWVIRNFDWPWLKNNIQLNIGVGYPF